MPLGLSDTGRRKRPGFLISDLHSVHIMDDLYVHFESENSAMTTPRKRQRKHNGDRATLTRCQLLVQDIERKEAAFSKFTSARWTCAPRSLLLAMPAELRQLILYHVLDDEDIVHGSLSEVTKTLDSVCKTFKEDMVAVSEQWAKRKTELLLVRSGAFDSYMSDLMTPLLSASKLNTRIAKLPGRNRKKQRSTYMNDVRKVEDKLQRASQAVNTLNTDTDSPHWHVQRWLHRPQDEVDDARTWKERREARMGASKAMKRGDKWEQTPRIAKEVRIS